MTKLRRRPPTRFLTFIVEPAPGFEPKNWRQTPDHYRILECVGPMYFLGSADAWKFLHNHEALRQQSTNRWALFLDAKETLTLDSNASNGSGRIAYAASQASSALSAIGSSEATMHQPTG